MNRQKNGEKQERRQSADSKTARQGKTARQQEGRQSADGGPVLVVALPLHRHHTILVSLEAETSPKTLSFLSS